MKSEDLLEQLLLLVDALGWDVAFTHSEDDEAIKGLIIGQKEYLDAVVSFLPTENKESDAKLH